jgi:hypothetical protein
LSFVALFGFHNSEILSLPFLLLVFFSPRFVRVSFVIFNFCILGHHRHLRMVDFDLLPINLYNDISDYALGMSGTN